VSPGGHLILGFPMDGRLWWLRWFDHPHWDGGTSTYHVELALSLLPEPTALDALPMLDAALAASRTEQLFARVQAGQIPALAIGMVFLDGVAKGWLPAEPKSFRFVREDCSVQVVELRHRVGSLPLVPDHGRRTGTLLGKDDYALDGFDDCHCVRITSADGDPPELVLPCCEAFRILYAPHRAIALALTNGPWTETRNQVLHDTDEKPTRVYPDGSWHVSLAGGVTAEHAAVLGNLVLGKVGRMAANNVWAAITKPSSFVLREVAAGRRPRLAVPGRLRAPIPFDWDVLEISVEGLRFRAAAAWIGLRIVSFTWPPPPAGPPTSFTWLPSKDDAPGKVRKKIDKPPPFSGTEEVTGGGGKEPIDTDNDPSKGSEAVWVKAPGARQDNAPDLVRGGKETSYVYEGERRKRRRREVGSISTGNAVPGPTGAAIGQAAANNRKPGSTRFAEVLAMFGRLAADARIEGHRTLDPAPQEMEHRGAVAAWRFPAPPRVGGRRSSWFKIDATTVRSALVCRLVIDGREAYWLEIELRPDESGYRSLAFTARREGIGETITALLGIAVARLGRWPEPPVLVGRAGLEAAVAWTHSQVGGSLNEGRALEAIRRSLAAEP
jgi:hypothetical protein